MKKLKCRHSVSISSPCPLCDKKWGNKAIPDEEPKTLRNMHLILELQEENRKLKKEKKNREDFARFKRGLYRYG